MNEWEAKYKALAADSAEIFRDFEELLIRVYREPDYLVTRRMIENSDLVNVPAPLDTKEYSELRRRQTQSAVDRARRERLAQSIGKHTKEQWEMLVNLCDDKCVMCGISRFDLYGEALSKDHIISLRFEGQSSDHITNIQPLCRHCNSRKLFKDDLEGVDLVSKPVRDLMLKRYQAAADSIKSRGY